MSVPSDTITLNRILEQAIGDLEAAADALQRTRESLTSAGAQWTAESLRLAAIAAGMESSRASLHCNEYAITARQLETRLIVLSDQVNTAKRCLGTLIHIATVVPARCPRPDVESGTWNLPLRKSHPSVL